MEQAFVLTTVSRFHIYVLKFNHAEECRSHKVYVVQSTDVIHTATISKTLTPNDKCHVFVACGRQLLAVSIPSQPQNRASSAKRQKLDEDSEDNDDIFADLLTSKRKQDGQSSQSATPSNIHLDKKHQLYSFDGPILDVCVCNKGVFVALVGEECGETGLEVFNWQEGADEAGVRISHNHTFLTGLKAAMFLPCLNKGSPSLLPGKVLYMVVPHRNTDTSIQETTEACLPTISQPRGIIHLHTKLFTLLFGRDAACLTSPVVLLCDSSGCVYAYSLQCGTKRLSLLCDLVGSEVMCVSRIVLERGCDADKDRLEDIALLESALGERGRDSSHTEGLVVIGKQGECCVFTSEAISGKLIWNLSLPHSVDACVVSGNQLYFSSGFSIQNYEIIVCRDQTNCMEVTVSAQGCLMKNRQAYTISLVSDNDSSEGNALLVVYENLELDYLATSQNQEEEHSTINDNSFYNRSMENIIQSSLSCSGEVEKVREKISEADATILQLNMLATLVNNARHENLTQEGNSVVSCICSVSSLSSVYGHTNTLVVRLENKTKVCLNNMWTVDVALLPRLLYNSKSPSTEETRHFVTPLSHGLDKKSGMDIRIPITHSDVSSSQLSYKVIVSLVFTLDKLSSHKPSQTSTSNLSVEIHSQNIDVIDCMHTSTTQKVNPKQGQLLPFQSLSLQNMASGTISSKTGGAGNLETFTVTLRVPHDLSKALKITEPSTMLNKLLSRGMETPQQHQQPQSQIHLSTPCGQRSVSLSASTDPTSKCYMLTVRSSDIDLLVQVRQAVKERLEVLGKEIPTSDSVADTKLDNKLPKYQKLTESVENLQTEIKSLDSSSTSQIAEATHQLCLLFDKYELT